MKKTINLLVSVIINLFLIAFLSCDLDTEDEIVEPGPVEFKAATPESGSIIRPGESITVFFSDPPDNLKVIPGIVIGPKSKITISGPFPLGDFSIELTWADGTHTLEYTIIPEGMVMIRGGEFQMGSNSELALDDEQPVHTVFVDSFLMDPYEVTVGEYRQFVEQTGHRQPDWGQIANYAPTDQHPIVFVSWHDAMAYATWADKRLPTEAEWEKAARGGMIAKTYSWGNITPTGTQCNFADKNLPQYWWSDKEVDDGYAFTAPVGSYFENGYGLFDMAGNVSEWCLDEYDANFYGVSQTENPLSGTNTIQQIIGRFDNTESNRVLRGGSWLVTSGNIRNSTRFMLNPASTNYSVGFRCVKDLP